MPGNRTIDGAAAHALPCRQAPLKVQEPSLAPSSPPPPAALLDGASRQRMHTILGHQGAWDDGLTLGDAPTPSLLVRFVRVPNQVGYVPEDNVVALVRRSAACPVIVLDVEMAATSKVGRVSDTTGYRCGTGSRRAKDKRLINRVGLSSTYFASLHSHRNLLNTISPILIFSLVILSNSLALQVQFIPRRSAQARARSEGSEEISKGTPASPGRLAEVCYS